VRERERDREGRMITMLITYNFKLLGDKSSK
jgi:hypothetical protein